MSRTLSKSWIGFAILAGLATVYIHITPPLDSTPSVFADALVPGTTVTLRLLAFGLVYWLIEKTAPNTLSRRIGWLHLGLIGVATLIDLVIDLVHSHTAQSAIAPPAEAIAGGMRILAGGIFLLAIVTAIRNAPKLVRKDLF